MINYTIIKYTISSDPLIQRGGNSEPGVYDPLFEQLTPESNCIVLDDWRHTKKVGQALKDWLKKRKMTGFKVRTTKAYPNDKKPRIWLVYPPVVPAPKTEIRGKIPK